MKFQSSKMPPAKPRPAGRRALHFSGKVNATEYMRGGFLRQGGPLWNAVSRHFAAHPGLKTVTAKFGSPMGGQNSGIHFSIKVLDTGNGFWISRSTVTTHHGKPKMPPQTGHRPAMGGAIRPQPPKQRLSRTGIVMQHLSLQRLPSYQQKPKK